MIVSLTQALFAIFTQNLVASTFLAFWSGVRAGVTVVDVSALPWNMKDTYLHTTTAAAAAAAVTTTTNNNVKI